MEPESFFTPPLLSLTPLELMIELEMAKKKILLLTEEIRRLKKTHNMLLLRRASSEAR